MAARDNVYLGNLLVGSKVSDALAGTIGWTWYHSDHLGSPRVVTNTTAVGANKQTIEVRKYWPFGDDVTGNPISLQTIRFASMEVDEDGKHYSDHARSFDLGTVRFVQPDPLLGTPWNRYAYVEGNSMNLVDPRGLVPRADDCTVFKGDCPAFPFVLFDYPTLPRWWNGDFDSVRRTLDAVKDAGCAALPEGATVGVSYSVGGIGSTTGSAEIAVNYNTGEFTVSFAGGGKLGWNGVAQLTGFGGFDWGLGDGNGPARPSTSMSYGVVWGGYAGGDDDSTFSAGVNVSATLIPGPTFGITRMGAPTTYSFGDLGLLSPFNLAMNLILKACKP